MPDVDPGQDALGDMDAVLAKKPEKDGHRLAAAMRHLCLYRDRITPADWAASSSSEKERLARLNSIISVVMALHFPIGEAPWADFAAARDWLRDLLGATPEPAVGSR